MERDQSNFGGTANWLQRVCRMAGERTTRRLNELKLQERNKGRPR